MNSSCIVTPDLAGPTRNGGIGTHCLYLARFLARLGQQVVIVHTGASDDPDRESWKATFQKEHGAKLLFLDELPDAPTVPILPHTTRHRTAHHVYWWLRTQNFDTVYFQDWQANGAICARARQTGAAFAHTRLVVVTHGPSEWIREGMHEFPAEGRESLVDDALERIAVAFADVLVSPSAYMISWLREHGWSLPRDTRVLPHLFESPIQAGPARAVAPGALRDVVFFGRLETRKGIEPFLGALEKIAEGSASQSPLHVTFLGKPDKCSTGPARDAITRTAEATAGRIDITIREDAGHREALAFLAEHPTALVVTPSLAENSPFAVIETLSLGQPFLASRRGGIPELVHSAEHLVDPTATELAARITRVQRDGLPALSAGWDASASEHAWTEFAQSAPRNNRPPFVAPRISVCVPHYNQPELLAGALERLATQTVAPHEVIIVDDGSAPEHTARWSELEEHYRSRGWIFVRGPHAGPGVARNTAARRASGDALVFCDADNIALPDMLERLGVAMAASGSDIVTCAFSAHLPAPDGSWPEAPQYIFSPIGDAPELAVIENFIGDTNFIARRQVFLDLGGFDEAGRAISEDWQFLLRAIVAGRSIAVLPEVAFRYRLTPASRARSHSAREATIAAWHALPANEIARYGRLLEVARGTFAAVAELGTTQSRFSGLESTKQHAKNLEKIIAARDEQLVLGQQHAANLEKILDERTRELTQMRAALAALAELRTQLEEMGVARAQAAHDLAQQRETLDLARHELQAQEKRRLRMEMQLTETREEVARLRQSVDERDRKIHRMQDSLSWRSTAPFRAFRRKFVDRYLSPGATPPSPPELKEAPYLISIDVPSVWDAAPGIGSFTGWCVSTTGAPARAIRAVVGPNEFPGRYGIRRADVALAHGFTAPESALCGFQIPYRLLVDADYVVSFEVQTEEGRWLPVRERALHTSSYPRAVRDYTAWVESFGRSTPERVGALRARLARLPVDRRPLLSVLLPTFNSPEKFLQRAIDSVREQIYDHWELCIADDCSTEPAVKTLLENLAAEESRIRVTFREENGHISRASNSALELVRGDYIVLLDHDDELSWDALAEVALTLAQHPDTDILYSDEDKIDEEGNRYDPYFKPDFLPDLLAGQNCLSHLSVFRTKLVREVGGFRIGYEGSQDWDLGLRVYDASTPARVRHIPKILYHWRAVSGSTAIEVTEKSYSLDAARRALLDHFERRGMVVDVRPVPGSHWRVIYPLPEKRPLVSIIIPTRNGAKILRACVDSIFARTSYAPYEIVIVNNRSDQADALTLFQELASRPNVRVVDYDAPFNFSAVVNHGVSQARGEIVCLLNNDIETIDDGWLSEMVSHAVRPEIGAVGAMLYYPDRTIQHAGIVLGLGGVANHAFGHQPQGTDGYKNRARLTQNYSAVTAACLVIRREIFKQVNGFNETDLAIAFNDVDFCIRVRNAGYRNLWTPFAELIHHESVSRGREDTPEKQARFDREVAYMRATWAEQLDHDPAYSPNLALSMEGWDLAWPPRT